MADYPFKINITTKDGTKKSFYDADFATSSDTVVSASVMVTRINAMKSASSFIESIEAPSLTSTNYNNTNEGIKFLSASVTHPNTGSIIFTDTEDTALGGLDHYEFYGTKVCSVLGLPEAVSIYTENFKLSDSSTDTTNYISGEFISDRLTLKKGFKMSPQARVQSNLVWDDAFGEGFLQWVSGSNTRMSIGYNNVTDRYTVSSPSGSFNLAQSNRFAGKNFVGNYIDPEDASGLEFYVGGTLSSIFYSTFTALNLNQFAAYQFQIYNSSGGTPFIVAPNEDSPLSVNGGAHFYDSSAGELPKIHIENRNGDANGPLILLEKDTTGEADNDVLGNIRWRGHDSGNTATDYARLYVRSTDVTNTTEDADFHIELMDNGTLGDKLVIGPTTATFTDDLSVGGDISVGGTVDGINIADSLNQAVKTTSTPTFADLTISDDLFVNDFARIDALRVGTSNTDPGDKNLFVEGVVTNHSTTSAALSFYEGSTTNNNRPVGKFAAGGRDSGVGVVQIQHQGTIANDDVILDLDFTNDGLIEDSQNYIIFQNVHGIQGHIDREVVYSTFTGGHISQRPSGSSFSDWKQGMVVKSTGDVIQPQGMFTGSISMAWPVVDLTTSQKDKSVMGVFTFTSNAGHNFAHMDNTLPAINYNAVGEGMVLVTDTNGNIETGDYLCSSTRTGHTEKQDDDILHNYTVAKATQPINFSTVSADSDLGYKSVLVACTYHCG